jgi:microcystin-dependent protein
MSHSSTINSIPVGTVFPFAGSSLPAGYLFCDGASISRSIYWELFEAIGLTFSFPIVIGAFEVPSLNNLGVYPSGVGNVTGIIETEDLTSLTTDFTLTADNIPSFSLTNSDIELNTVFNYSSGNNQTTKSVNQGTNAWSNSGNDWYRFDTNTTTLVDCVAIDPTDFSPVYTSTATPITEPVTIANNSMSAILITYIIKAWSSDTFYPSQQPVALIPTSTPPSDSINPIADIPNLSGFIYSQ